MSSPTSGGDRRGDDAVTVLSKDDLWTDIDMAVRYRTDAGQAIEFYHNYRTFATAEERLTCPLIRSVLRTEAGRLPVTVIYAGESQTQLKVAVERELAEKLTDNDLALKTVQTRNVELPTEHAQVVEQKEITGQRHQQRRNELAVEELEAEHKRIKAQGQVDASRTPVESLSDEALTQKHIGKLDETDTVCIPVGDGSYSQFVRLFDSDRSSSSGSFAGLSSNTTSASSKSSTSSGSENETSN